MTEVLVENEEPDSFISRMMYIRRLRKNTTIKIKSDPMKVGAVIDIRTYMSFCCRIVRILFWNRLKKNVGENLKLLKFA